MKPILYYVHDPMCSWCWGFSNSLKELLAHLPQEIEVHRLLGGLAPDTNIPMPVGMQQQIKSNWTRIEDTISGVKFNFDFWIKNVPRRSTYPACRAVIAARQQGDIYDISMTKAIQKANYLQARNPSDNVTLIDLAKELGLSTYDFERDLHSQKIQDILMGEILLSRELYAESFPSLILKTDKGNYSIKLEYNDSTKMIASISDKVNDSKNN